MMVLANNTATLLELILKFLNQESKLQSQLIILMDIALHQDLIFLSAHHKKIEKMQFL